MVAHAPNGGGTLPNVPGLLVLDVENVGPCYYNPAHVVVVAPDVVIGRTIVGLAGGRVVCKGPARDVAAALARALAEGARPLALGGRA